MNKTPLFTIVTFAYCRLHYTQQSLRAIMNQTYKNLEIIVVNNGGTPEVTDYLIQQKAADDRIKIIHFSQNYHSDTDMGVMLNNCWIPARKEITGDYIFYISDDDLISLDYVEKMVALFQGNPKCITAAGLSVRIGADGKIIDPEPRTTNYRPRYMPGHLLVLSIISTNFNLQIFPTMFSCSGTIFTINREFFLKMDAYTTVCFEYEQLYGILPFGDTGFDETAFVYFRKHDDQLSSRLTSVGYAGIKESIAFLKKWRIEERWEVFGKDVARGVVHSLLIQFYSGAVFWFVVNFYNFRFKSCLKLLQEVGTSSYFWSRLPLTLWSERKQFWYYLKSKLRLLFESNPSLTQKIPLLAPLKKKVYE